jgi:DNA-binding HxlR family transcriptional regulator
MKSRPDPVDRSLEIVGHKWTFPIVRELLDGPRRFTEIARALPRANPKMITARLRELETAGLVTRTAYAEVPPRVEYSLTAQGHALGPVIDALRSWGNGLHARRPRRHRSAGVSRVRRGLSVTAV